MPRATCRCGQVLSIPVDPTNRVVCPTCGANIRIRRSTTTTAPSPTAPSEEGGYLKFNCPCGRRLKVLAGDQTRPTHGKCPDCGRVVPVPEINPVSRDPESPTDELSTADTAVLEAWTRRHLDREEGTAPHPSVEPAAAAPPAWRSEAGMRICPGCGRPVHLGASTCRACGIPVPKR
jgi:hypothetical protein